MNSIRQHDNIFYVKIQHIPNVKTSERIYAIKINNLQKLLKKADWFSLFKNKNNYLFMTYIPWHFVKKVLFFLLRWWDVFENST